MALGGKMEKIRSEVYKSGKYYFLKISKIIEYRVFGQKFIEYRVFGQNLVESVESTPDILLFVESQVRNSSSPSSPSSRRFSRRVNRRVDLVESVRQGVL